MDTIPQDRLAVFDVEGVLIPKVRFILFEVAGRMGLWPFIKAAVIGLLYETGLITLKTALRSLYRLFSGLPSERFLSLFERVPLMPGVEYILKELRESGFKIALISSGIPTVALRKLGGKLGADYVSGLEIGLSEGHLTGEIWGDVIEPRGKAVALERILRDRGPSTCRCVGVADDRNNLSMLELCDLKIGYNPDFLLSYKSDHVVRGDLSAIIPIIKGEKAVNRGQGLPKSNAMRRAIHISGFGVPLVCAYLVNRYAIASLILLFAAMYGASEAKRMFGNSLPVITDITMKAAGKWEFQEFVASPIFYALGIVISLVLFPEPVGYASVTVLTLGDGFAALLGQRFGRTRMPFNKAKNFEGTVCGFLFALMGSLFFVDLIRALVVSAVGMLTEILPLPVNDNLTIPLTSGLVLTLSSIFPAF